MRVRQPGPTLTVRAIAGLHVVALAWDFTAPLQVGNGPLPSALADLLGFAIERTEFDEAGEVVERYMLRGMKRFKAKDQGLPAGTLVPLDEHPIQSFLWADYTPKPATRYVYRVIPVRGLPKNLQIRDDEAVEVDVTTEPEVSIDTGQGTTRHDVYFNRGVIGSQAYERRFEDDPDPDEPDSPEMVWLSRGLFEALTRFIGLARDEHFGLRAAFYEFHYRPIAAALRTAVDKGADVRIVYDAESSYKVENVATLQETGLLQTGIHFPRTVSEGIRHNKFIVLLEDDEPVAVWTGSTNISAGGIFGHSNVGHVVWDPAIARKYLDYWTRLSENKTPGALRTPNRTATPTPAGKPPANSVVPLFSPRDTASSNATLQWYADRAAEATEVLCLTVAFNLDEVFQNVIKVENDVLRFIVKDDDLGSGETIGQDRDVLFAGGGRLASGSLANFLAERGNPLNSNDYIHTKFMLVDPLSDDPLVVSGSANFSRPSQRSNDENMIVARGDTRLADIYFGEFMRIFDHHYARYIVRKLANAGEGDPNAGYLKDKPADWVRTHFTGTSYKAKRRKYFVGTA